MKAKNLKFTIHLSKIFAFILSNYFWEFTYKSNRQWAVETKNVINVSDK